MTENKLQTTADILFASSIIGVIVCSIIGILLGGVYHVTWLGILLYSLTISLFILIPQLILAIIFNTILKIKEEDNVK